MSTLAMPGDFELRSAPKTEMKWALVASVVLHLAVFFWVALTTMYGSTPSAQPQGAKPMTVTLTLLPAPGVETSTDTPAGSAAGHVSAQVMKPKAAPTPANATELPVHTSKSTPQAIATPMPALTTPAAKVASAEPVASAAPVAQPAGSHSIGTTAGAPGGTGQSDSVGVKGSAASVAPATQVASNPDSDKLMNDAIAAYRRAFFREVSDAKQYPQAARRAGYAGRVTLTVTVSRGTPRADVTGQSSIEELDEMAMKMARQAMQETKVPDILRTAEFSFRLPVVFQLID